MPLQADVLRRRLRPARKRQVKTKRMATAEAARNARADLMALLERGEARPGGNLRLTEARENFCRAAREGKVLNKRGHRYKPRSIDDIEEVLRVHVEPSLGTKRIIGIRRGDVQAIIDELGPTLSGSRVRSVANAIRSLYRWAQDRDLAEHDPAALLRLPAMDATPIERVASPAEFAQLIAVLPLEVGLPYALAGYAMGRRAQIIRLRWTDVDLDVGAIEWGVEWEARKYDASPPDRADSSRSCSRCSSAAISSSVGRRKGFVCPPLTQPGRQQACSTRAGSRFARADDWKSRQTLQPITLQEARHTAATWLDAAGVRPKVASVLMGHSTPERQLGAAPITLARYTHALPEDIERARKHAWRLPRGP